MMGQRANVRADHLTLGDRPMGGLERPVLRDVRCSSDPCRDVARCSVSRIPNAEGDVVKDPKAEKQYSVLGCLRQVDGGWKHEKPVFLHLWPFFAIVFQCEIVVRSA